MRTDRLLIRCWVDYYLNNRYETFPDLDKRSKRSLFVDDMLYYAREIQIVAKKSGTNNTKSGSTGNISWINVVLTEDDIAELSDATPEPTNVMLGILAIANKGYSVSLKHNPDKVQFSASLFGIHPIDGVGLVGLSAFADDPLDALFVLCYKYHVRLGGEIPTPNKETGTTRRFG
jgi:hypothetical protein